MRHCGVNHGFAHLDVGFVILGQATIFREPAKRPFNYPSLGQQDEALCSFGPKDGLQQPAAVRLHPVDQVARIAPIREDHAQPWPSATGIEKHLFGAIAVLDICRRNDQDHDQTQRINKHMPLAPDDFFFPRRTREFPRGRRTLLSGCPRRPRWVRSAFPLRSDFPRECCRGSFARRQHSSNDALASIWLPMAADRGESFARSIPSAGNTNSHRECRAAKPYEVARLDSTTAGTVPDAPTEHQSNRTGNASVKYSCIPVYPILAIGDRSVCKQALSVKPQQMLVEQFSK
jgi:hypothetical protein